MPLKKLGPLKCSNCGETTERPRKGLCVPCYRREYYKANRKRLIQYTADWIRKNPERHRAYARAVSKRKYHALSPEERLKRSRERGANMSEEEKEYRRKKARERYQKNKHKPQLKDQRRKAKHRRRSKKKNVKADLTHKQWKAILIAFDYRCAYCGKQPENLTQDHLIPVKKNGPYTIGNIVPACLQCNQIKQAGPPLNSVQPLLL